MSNGLLRAGPRHSKLSETGSCQLILLSISLQIFNRKCADLISACSLSELLK